MSADAVKGFTLAWRYSLFASLATLANLGAQRLVIDRGGLAVALVVGTGVGLVVKYALDKRWIFRDGEGGLAAHRRKFSLYTLMGLVTTLVFWGTETLFWAVWGTDFMREVGAVIGLTVGYIVKFNLDKRFVFVPVRGHAA
ncbi:GtrA family protein [Pseudooceanicola sp. LIPI14-2-Ac024]|uniref:GtrA family protein n=1 Tax=Pseudooceanicola sp. LIPI14-2-Ac024 TaxID=3344875 RepID=UPI0035D06557